MADPFQFQPLVLQRYNQHVGQQFDEAQVLHHRTHPGAFLCISGEQVGKWLPVVQDRNHHIKFLIAFGRVEANLSTFIKERRLQHSGNFAGNTVGQQAFPAVVVRVQHQPVDAQVFRQRHAVLLEEFRFSGARVDALRHIEQRIQLVILDLEPLLKPFDAVGHGVTF